MQSILRTMIENQCHKSERPFDTIVEWRIRYSTLVAAEENQGSFSVLVVALLSDYGSIRNANQIFSDSLLRSINLLFISPLYFF